MENCSLAKIGLMKDINSIAWAPFAEQAMKILDQRHNIENKCRTWEEQMSGKTRVFHLEEGSTQSTKIVNKWVGLPPPHVKLFEEQEQQQIHNLQRFVQDRLQVAKTNVEVARTRVDVSMRNLHKAEGA